VKQHATPQSCPSWEDRYTQPPPRVVQWDCFTPGEGNFGSRLYNDMMRSLSRKSKTADIAQAEIMKCLFRIWLLALVGVALARDTAFADPASELPKRTSGLWRITTVSTEVGMQTHEVCIAEGDSIIGFLTEDCAQPSVRRAEDQVIVTIECGAGNIRNVESLLFTGDFKSWYRAQSKLTSGPHRSGVSIDARLLSTNCAH